MSSLALDAPDTLESLDTLQAHSPILLEPGLVDVARGQSGMLTTAQAHRWGLDRFALSRLVVGGVLLHPGRGLYAVASLVDTSPEPWHRHLVAGARLLHDDIVLTGVSTAVAHDLTIWNLDLTRPKLLRPVKRTTTLSCFHMRPLGDHPIVKSPLGPSVPLANALLDIAMVNPVEATVATVDSALRAGKVTRTELDAELSNRLRWPRSGRARSVVQLCDGRRDSVAESRVGVVLTLAGFDLVPQVTVRNGRGWLVGRVDFLVKGTMLIIEVDGKVKYASGDPEVLWAEKKREDALRALGYTVVRLTWADLERPGAVVAKVRAALAR